MVRMDKIGKIVDYAEDLGRPQTRKRIRPGKNKITLAVGNEILSDVQELANGETVTTISKDVAKTFQKFKFRVVKDGIGWEIAL